MSQITRAAQPLNTALRSQYIFTNEVRTANPLGVEPISITRDRTTFIGAVRGAAYATGLYAMPGDSSAAVLIKTMPNKVTAFTETTDGEALCSTITSGGSCIVYRSTGWGATLAQKQAATWTQVVTLPGSQGTLPDYSMGLFAMSQVGSQNIMALSDQGSTALATTATGDNAADNATAIANNVTRAVHGYITVDGGQNFIELVNLLKISPTKEPRQIVGVHIHSFVYDAEWDRFWLTYGDYSVGNQGTNLFGDSAMQLIYCDDWRNVLTGGVATWTAVPFPPDYSIASFVQFVNIRITPKAMIFATDGSPYGICTFQRTGYRTLGKFRNENFLSNTEPNTGIIGRETVQAGPGLPLFSGQSVNNIRSFDGNTPKIGCSHDDGVQFYEIWSDPNRVRRVSDKVVAYGPDINNKVIAVTMDTMGGTRPQGSVISWTLSGPVTI